MTTPPTTTPNPLAQPSAQIEEHRTLKQAILDPGAGGPMPTADKFKMMFGFVLLLALVLLAMIFAVGHVVESSSFGLMPIVTALAALLGSFASWAFGAKDSGK